MRRVLIIAAAVLLVGALALPVAAGGDGTARNQVTTNTYHLAIGNGHDWTIVFACGSLTATGAQDVTGPTETITATLNGGTISFHSVYDGGWNGQPYSWDGTFPVAGGTLNATDSNGGVYTGYSATLVNSSTTDYRDHGAYVAAMGGGPVAAHSCVGMPVQAQR
jgi:hypothetical protein